MGDLKKILGYASLGAAKVAAKRAWESEDYLESMISSVETGFWAEAGKNFLSGEFSEEEEGD